MTNALQVALMESPDRRSAEGRDFAQPQTSGAHSPGDRMQAPLANPLWDWRRLTPRDREAAWLELDDWIEHVIVQRHHLGGFLPPNWGRAPQLTAELIRLHELEIEIQSEEWQIELIKSCRTWPCLAESGRARAS
ncbi:MAG TPA: hypothetical protein VG015_05255 [Candidatus Dormibacteraeota bacterium]|jgi:hypothetical protein|nr:hypothetical protein [Candidatus Dormibacteraeota bacterium]